MLALSPTSHFLPFLSPLSGATLIRIQAGAKEDLEERKTDIAPPPPFNTRNNTFHRPCLLHQRYIVLQLRTFIFAHIFATSEKFSWIRNEQFSRVHGEVAKEILLGFDRRNAFDTRVSRIPAKRAPVSNSITTDQNWSNETWSEFNLG